jgi:alpha-L-fucosidase
MNTKTTRAIAGAVVAMSLMANAVMAQQADADKPQKKFSETRDPVVTESTTTNGITSLRVASADGKELATSKIDLRMHYKPATEASKNIRRWESYEFGAFIHFNLNTFVGDEFAQGPASLYRPSKLNVPSWAKLFRQAGMGYAVLTTRHTSEFLLWPSKTSTQTVTATVEPTDVVKAFVESCRKEGVAPDHSGIYRPEDCAMILELKKAIADPSMYPAALNLNAKATASNIYRNDPTYGPVSAVDDHSATRWATDDGTTSAWLEVDLGKPATLGRAVIEQAYPELKRIRKFAIEYQHGNEWKACYQGENPGKELDVTFDPVSARHVRLNIIKSTDGPTISEFQLYPPAISN